MVDVFPVVAPAVTEIFPLLLNVKLGLTVLAPETAASTPSV